MAVSVRPSNIMASWPAPLGSWRGGTPTRVRASDNTDRRCDEHRTAAVRCTSLQSKLTPRLAAMRPIRHDVGHGRIARGVVASANVERELATPRNDIDGAVAHRELTHRADEHGRLRTA